MEKKKLFVRIVCWFGAIGDFLIFVEMAIIRYSGRSISLPCSNMNGEQTYFVESGAALMIARAAVLIWAQNKPSQRKESVS